MSSAAFSDLEESFFAAGEAMAQTPMPFDGSRGRWWNRVLGRASTWSDVPIVTDFIAPEAITESDAYYLEFEIEGDMSFDYAHYELAVA